MPAKSERYDRDAPASVICDKFGGLAKMAAAYDPPKAMSTISRWLESGNIPPKHHEDTKEAARRAKVRLGDADFYRRRQLDQAAA